MVDITEKIDHSIYMKHELLHIKIKDILDLKRNGMLFVNSEYQRGPVWSKVQQKKLIDSVFRGYPLPLFYLHYQQRQVGNMKAESYEIIDGQQRINALFDFREGAIKLFDPIKDEEEARFPQFIKNVPCPWAGKDFVGLDQELQEKFDETELIYAKIDTSSEDEARDLFIRLQAGLPLNAQEKRDAWPGGFTEFVLRFGGKPEIKRYPGHDFFIKKTNKTPERGSARQLCAQVGMLFLREATKGNWIDTSSPKIDEFYYQQLGLQENDTRIVRFQKVLTQTFDLFKNYTGKNLQDHEVIHVILLVDSLMSDEYISGWQSNFITAFDKFRENHAIAKKNKAGKFWENYSMYTQASANKSSSLQLRHKFFSEEMLEIIMPKKKDPTRIYGPIEREIIYYRDNRKCQVCGKDISWEELEIHHIQEHQNGGKTNLNNGVSVHKACHPKGQAAIDFEKKWIIEHSV
jgi:hypothetical protein